MNEFLIRLGTLSLGGGIAIIILALAARLSRARYSARWRCWIWLLLCLRLAVPMSIPVPQLAPVRGPIQLPTPSDPVIYTYQPQLPQPSQQPEFPSRSQPSDDLPGMPSADDLPSRDVATTPESRSITLFQIAAIVWGFGAEAMVGWYLLSHLRFLRYLRRWGDPVVNPQTIRLYNALGDQLNLSRRPKLYLCTGLRAPMLAGVLHPRLLLPEGEYGEDEIRYALLHELTHFKRRDIWLKTLALWVNALHWFNPLMWYMTRLIERDTELACDEAALKQLPQNEHGAYGRTILNAVERLKSAT